MNYSAAISDFFKSPKWTMNMLLGGACALIPFVGQIVVLGWAVTGFWGRDEENYETFPDFDFSNFGKYLERGLWPFLVTFVASLVMVPVIWVVTIPTMLIGTLAAGTNEKAGGCFAVVMPVVMMFHHAHCLRHDGSVHNAAQDPASITQDFAKSFNFDWVKRFVSLMRKEIFWLRFS